MIQSVYSRSSWKQVAQYNGQKTRPDKHLRMQQLMTTMDCFNGVYT